MRTILLASLTWLSMVGPAAADELTALPIKPVTGDACTLLGGDGKSCKQVLAKPIKQLGTATVYRVDTEGTVNFVIALEADGKTALSAPLTTNTSDCGAGKCDNLLRVAPVINTVTVGGRPAVSLELTIQRAREYNEAKLKPRYYTVRQFAVCGHGSNGFACQQASFGSLDEPCTASMSPKGEVRSRCDKTTSFFLP